MECIPDSRQVVTREYLKPPPFGSVAYRVGDMNLVVEG